MKKVHMIPADDIQTNHNVHQCTCQPVVARKTNPDGEEYIEVVHRYTDNKGYIKQVCKELGISTPKFSYNQLSQIADN